MLFLVAQSEEWVIFWLNLKLSHQLANVGIFLFDTFACAPFGK